MPVFVTTLRVTPSFSAVATCPACRAEGKSRDRNDGRACRSAREADRLALYDLQSECTCSPRQKFLRDDTPEGFQLWFDGLGGLKRLYLHGGTIYSPVGPLEPGALPLILVADQQPPAAAAEKYELRRRFLALVEKTAGRFRRKGFAVQLAYERPSALSDDPLPPFRPERKKKAKAAAK